MKRNPLLLIRIFIVSVVCNAALGATLYVDDDAAAGGDGLSWATAYRFLQDALVVAGPNDVIRVGQGRYQPDRSWDCPEGSGEREVYFEVPEGVSLKGGYAGLVGVDPNKRDVELYETVLSGDLAGDDVDVNDPSELYGESTRLDNSNHVVIAYSSTVIDGFLITGGWAFRQGTQGSDVGPNPCNCGGGVYVVGDDVSVLNCRIQDNMSYEGGGGIYVCFDLTGICLHNCRFIDNANHWEDGGGGVCAWSSQIDVVDCEFVGNWSRDGGGLCCNVDEINITGCLLRENRARYDGGGVFVRNGYLHLSKCLFASNISERYGGGAFCFDQIDIADCCLIGNKASNGGGLVCKGPLFLKRSGVFGNYADGYGGAILASQSESVSMNSCSFSGNKSVYGGVLSINHNISFSIPSALVSISNCIMHENAQPIFGRLSNISVDYSVIDEDDISFEGADNLLLWGQGNLSVDPCFVDPGYWDSNGTPDDSEDDFFVAGDYHLKSQAGRWDVDSETWVCDEVTSPCIDAGDPNSPIMVEPFPNGGRINMGAYGGTVEASKSYFGTEPAEVIIASDINGDGRVNFADLTILISHWTE